MQPYSNITVSARGQVASNLWDELTQVPADCDNALVVAGAVDFVVGGMMQFSDLAGYIAFHELEFHTPLRTLDPLGETPTSFLRTIVREDLTRYTMEHTLPRHLATRERNFVWNAPSRSWWTKEFAAGQNS